MHVYLCYVYSENFRIIIDRLSFKYNELHILNLNKLLISDLINLAKRKINFLLKVNY